jgi:hypothetical protein
MNTISSGSQCVKEFKPSDDSKLLLAALRRLGAYTAAPGTGIALRTITGIRVHPGAPITVDNDNIL